MSGFPAILTNAFGVLLVRGLSLVPRPLARITAVSILMGMGTILTLVGSAERFLSFDNSSKMMYKRSMAKPHNSMHRTQLFLPQDLHDTLRREAQSEGITISELVRNMLNRQLHQSSRSQTEKGTSVLLEMGMGEG